MGGAVAFLGTGGGGLQLAVLLMQAVNIGQGGIAGGFGGCGIEGVHPVGAQLLVFFQQILVLLVGGNVAGFDGLHQIGGGAGFGGSI